MTPHSVQTVPTRYGGPCLELIRRPNDPLPWQGQVAGLLCCSKKRRLSADGWGLEYLPQVGGDISLGSGRLLIRFGMSSLLVLILGKCLHREFWNWGECLRPQIPPLPPKCGGLWAPKSFRDKLAHSSDQLIVRCHQACC